jgi:hypothetical protein
MRVFADQDLQVVSGFSDHGPVSIARVQRLDCLTGTWHTHEVSLPLSQDIDYSDGLYGHSLVAHGDLLVLFGGLLSGLIFNCDFQQRTVRINRLD